MMQSLGSGCTRLTDIRKERDVLGSLLPQLLGNKRLLLLLEVQPGCKRLVGGASLLRDSKVTQDFTNDFDVWHLHFKSMGLSFCCTVVHSRIVFMLSFALSLLHRAPQSDAARPDGRCLVCRPSRPFICTDAHRFGGDYACSRFAALPRHIHPWNRRLHVHAHTRVYASACLLCVGGSPPCTMFPERSYSPRCTEVGVASPSHLAFPGFGRCLFHGPGACRCVFRCCSCVVVCTPPTSFLLAPWDGCAERSWWDWQQSSCSLACSSALLNRCCGDEGARRWLLPVMW